MDILIKALQFFLCFTILVGIHELGHFIMARVFRIRVEKFYIFFDPWFSLFKFRRGDTEYGVGSEMCIRDRSTVWAGCRWAAT